MRRERGRGRVRECGRKEEMEQRSEGKGNEAGWSAPGCGASAARK